MARVAVVFTGGTISTRVRPGRRRQRPDRSTARRSSPGRPGWTRSPTSWPIDRGRTPASHFTFPDAARHRRRRSATALADPTIDGAVVVQGTDTIEETAFCWDLVLDGAEAGRRDRRDAGVRRRRLRRPGQPARRGAGRGRRRRCAAPGVVVCLAGTIEPADDVIKMHASALDTFREPERRLARPGDGGRASCSTGDAPAGATSPTDREPPSGSTSSPRPSRWTARCSTPRSRPARTGSSSPRPAPGTPIRALLAAAVRAIEAGIPVALRHALSGRRAGDRPTPSRAAARRGSGPGALPVGHLCAVKARVALALGLGAGLDRDGLAALLADPVGLTPCRSTCSSPAGSPRSPATTGFGWVEAIGIRDGRVAFAGSEVALETRADPFTERIALEPDEVAIPGLTDAHLHLARRGRSRPARST